MRGALRIEAGGPINPRTHTRTRTPKTHAHAPRSDVLAQLRVGPPLLLVVEDLDLDPAARQVEALCGVAGCDPDSLVNRVRRRGGGGVRGWGRERAEGGSHPWDGVYQI